ncbi:uncharacterized protein LOC127803030 isoform X2 [Diospyros lotus]|uniref:uncharacterized protein LOC127803030 isoform X2 n=1 Tax=Diospyros lotus TaxID=55363 RepID=UPI00225843E4|nr:uncharacterized protein LOC127803030 isoform X2 [Diospyros lotus]
MKMHKPKTKGVFSWTQSNLKQQVAASRMTTRTALTAQSTKKAELLKLIETEKEAVRDWDLDPYSASNRKVPNGPDPIHNRRAGKFREPPGRV